MGRNQSSYRKSQKKGGSVTMEGIQKTVHDALVYMTGCVRDGRYGEDDNFDSESFQEDLDDNVVQVTE
jgi:hypothetical protein